MSKKVAKDDNAASAATEADQATRRAKLEELRRRREEAGPRTEILPPVRPSQAGPGGDRRTKLPESSGRAGDGGGNTGGSGRGRLLERLSGGGAGGDGDLRGKLLRAALQKRRTGQSGQGASDTGEGPLLRRLKERGGLGGGQRGGSDREAELEERVRRLEAELKSLRELATKKED